MKIYYDNISIFLDSILSILSLKIQPLSPPIPKTTTGSRPTKPRACAIILIPAGYSPASFSGFTSSKVTSEAAFTVVL
jgi:hypothetical protein